MLSTSSPQRASKLGHDTLWCAQLCWRLLLIALFLRVQCVDHLGAAQFERLWDRGRLHLCCIETEGWDRLGSHFGLEVALPGCLCSLLLPLILQANLCLCIVHVRLVCASGPFVPMMTCSSVSLLS